MKIAYFVHDLNDPAVERRVRMLLAGGAQLVLLGFRRKPDPVAEVAGVPAHDLGRTYDARLGRRAALAVAQSLHPGRWRALIGDCDVVLARNLEMLAIGTRARDVCAPGARLVYECLDIHRMMLNRGAAGSVLRAFERALLKRCSLLLVSSPAFVTDYFAPVQHLETPHLLVENKVFQELPLETLRRPAVSLASTTPWRIGWFGVIRCAKSLEMLSTLAERNPDVVEVVIRGRPALHEFDDFDAKVSALPNLRFEGPYKPTDLADLYGQVHFTWAIDYFDEGRNSAMLLANRLYEGALHASVSLAQSGVETGRWVESHHAGVVMAAPLTGAETLLRTLTPQGYEDLAGRVAAIPVGDLAVGPEECAELVRRLAA